MANTLYRVISARGATVPEGAFSITYLIDETFYADSNNPGIVKLLAFKDILEVVPIPPLPAHPPVPIVIEAPGEGPVGPAGPPGPVGPNGASTAHHLATTGADVVIDTAAPPSVGQVLTATSATAATWQTPTDNDSAFINADGSVAFTADQSMGSHKLTGVTNPTALQDAATKNYVDTLSVTAQTVTAGLTTAARWKLNTNTGASADIALTLPAITTVGERYMFAVTAAHYIRVNNFDASTTIHLGNLGVTAAGGFVRSNLPGAMLEILAVSSTQWFARVTGDWTVDA